MTKFRMMGKNLSPYARIEGKRIPSSTSHSINSVILCYVRDSIFARKQEKHEKKAKGALSLPFSPPPALSCKRLNPCFADHDIIFTWIVDHALFALLFPGSASALYCKSVSRCTLCDVLLSIIASDSGIIWEKGMKRPHEGHLGF